MSCRHGTRLVTCTLFTAALVAAASPCPCVAGGPFVQTIELNVRVEADPESTASVDLPLPDPVSLDGVSLVHVDALLVTFLRLNRQLDSRATYSVSLLDEGAPVVTLLSGSLKVNSGDGTGNWFTVERNAARLLQTVTVDAVRVSVAAGHPEMRAIASGLHAGETLRLHFARGEGHETQTIPNVSEIRQQGFGDSPWAPYQFSEPVSPRNLVFVYHSRFGWGDPVGSSTSASELMLSDGTTVPLDDAYAPSLGVPRIRALSVTNSLLIDDSLRERFRNEPELMITGWRWRVQVAGSGAAMRPGNVMFYFLYDCPDCGFRRADSNADTQVDLSDAVYTLDWLFLGGDQPGCVAAANTNGDGAVDLSDPVYLLNFLFLGGPPPAAPFPDCGPGTLEADEALGCETPPGNCP